MLLVAALSWKGVPARPQIIRAERPDVAWQRWDCDDPPASSRTSAASQRDGRGLSWERARLSSGRLLPFARASCWEGKAGVSPFPPFFFHHHHLLATCWSGQNRSIFSHLRKSSPSDLLLLLHSFFAGRGNSLVKPLDTRIVACSFPGSQIALKLPSEWQFLSSILLNMCFTHILKNVNINLQPDSCFLKKKNIKTPKVYTLRAPQHTCHFFT